MRIALVSEHASPLAALGGVDAGGQNVYVAALAAGLAGSGHDVTVYTRRDSPGGPARVEVAGGYAVERVLAGPPTEVPKDDLLPYMDAFGDQLRARWLNEPVDLVHAHFWMSGLASLRATRGLEVPVVQTFHALGSVKRREQGPADTSPASRIDHERRLCREATHVVATCTDEVEELRSLGLESGRASVIPCGVDVRRFRPGPRGERGDRHRLLVIGRLVERKGVGNAIEALARIPDAELQIAGGPRADALDADPEVHRLRRLARRLGVADRVRFLGSVDASDVPDLIRASDAVVAVPWYEPFGIVPLEAMACARPVVGTAVGGLLDTVVPGHTGELVAPRRPHELARVLRELLDDPARRAAYGRAGRRRAVELYDWRQVVARAEAVYHALAGTTVRPTTEVLR
ncbi:glycosyltransferase [Nocardioides sp. cx-173]|uniref:glycosyltransferase n=1 Tax=Nocardioides sp. cx-173 TaxID=2898796 RepID=UPI001E39F18B|nr:glycosyltransferase [Nocardioides sp. cx-173]MCD4527374.1 glycosyltransferase [Nocardioides sp. cx-173]UGB42416.1 glycosyltransferase [Nocardioides sp. cx-173]